MKKLISCALALMLAFGAGGAALQGQQITLSDISATAAAPKVDTESVSLYGVSGWAEGYLEVPAERASHQIKIGGASNVTYSLYSGNSVKVDSTGLVEVNYKTTYWYSTGGKYMYGYPSPQEDKGEFIKTTKDLATGTSKVKVTADGTVLYVTVTVSDYSPVYAEEQLDKYISEHVTASMTDKEKITEAAKMAAGYDYSVSSSNATKMIVTGGGDCWASTDLIIRFCKKLGLDAWSRNGNRDFGAGSGHMNAMVQASDGSLFEVEAGYSGKAPRMYSVRERSTLFSYRTNSTYGGVEVYQYDGKTIPETLVIPNELGGKPVVSVGNLFISSTTGVKKVVIPSGVKSIGKSAFNSCTNLEEINLPASLESIGDMAFIKCSSLKTITAEKGCGFTVENGAVFNKEKTVLYSVPNAEEADIPETVSEIRPYAFYYNDNIKKIILPDSVKTVGEGAFAYCGKLEWLRLGDNTETLADGIVTMDRSLKELLIPKSVKELPDSLLYNAASGITVYSAAPDRVSELLEKGSVTNGSSKSLDERVKGDADRDGELSVSDVLIAQQSLAGWDVDISFIGADVNGDGDISVADALLMQQKLAQWDVIFK